MSRSASSHAKHKRPADAQRYAYPIKGSSPRDLNLEHLGPIPAPRYDPAMTLDGLIGAHGAQAIEASGEIRFHAVGDTGGADDYNMPEEIAETMADDYQLEGEAHNNPAFLLHLGDVAYGDNKRVGYRDQFYRPYRHYPGKTIAIPGNRDGEVYAYTDTESLQAFRENFCVPQSDVPEMAHGGSNWREMPAQPGVYWLLEAPFVRIIGLYSNLLDNPGSLLGRNGNSTQKDWLGKTLKHIARKNKPAKALIIAVHHPPFSNGGPKDSPDMLADIDRACEKAGVMYDAVLSGHAHNYQRFTRYVTFDGTERQIPCIIAGGGGRTLGKLEMEAQGQRQGDHVYERSLKAHGYLLVTVSAEELTITMYQVPSEEKIPFDLVTVDLKAHQLVKDSAR